MLPVGRGRCSQSSRLRGYADEGDTIEGTPPIKREIQRYGTITFSLNKVRVL